MTRRGAVLDGPKPLVAAGPDFARNADAIIGRAAQSLFDQLNRMCEGCIAVDAEARVIWINGKYLTMLGLERADEAIGRPIEDVIPHSLMRQVVHSGEPLLLDIMEFGARSFVVMRMPLFDAAGAVIGAIGFVLYDRPDFLRPLVAKFSRLQAELREAERELAEERRPRYSLSGYIGTSPATLETKRKVRRAAQQRTTVLLTGETGTGKEMLAHAIHQASDRARAPFIAINVAAVPEALLEAEFFGAVAGAYTGADRGRDGKFRIKDDGTLFLDEIGDMPLPLQAKLLRVLQEGEFEPLGSDRIVTVDVRIIAATRVDLAALVAEGRFRADLYYRLNVLQIARAAAARARKRHRRAVRTAAGADRAAHRHAAARADARSAGRAARASMARQRPRAAQRAGAGGHDGGLRLDADYRRGRDAARWLRGRRGRSNHGMRRWRRSSGRRSRGRWRRAAAGSPRRRACCICRAQRSTRSSPRWAACPGSGTAVSIPRRPTP